MSDGYYYEVELQDYVNQGVGSCLRIDSNDIDFLRELHLDIAFKMSKRSKEMKCEKVSCDPCFGSCEGKCEADSETDGKLEKDLREFLGADPEVKSW